MSPTRTTNSDPTPRVWAPRASLTSVSERAATESAVAGLAKALRFSPVAARLLVQRGQAEPEQALHFLNPSLKDLHSPFLMRGMKQAVERLQAAIAKQETVLVYGDYDVDGTLATVILKTAIELLGGRCDFHVPHRLREGYGMRGDVIERAAAEGVRLIISVDTGIRAFAEAETARRAGVDLIVTDHHLPHGMGLPAALAVLNPNDDACPYPGKGLCGAGVAFKLAQAMLEAAGRQRLIPSFLKVAAIATVADAVPLVGENRTIVRLGLEGLRRAVNPGLKALMELARLDPSRAPTTTEVAFRLAPRLNAAGRMNVAEDVVELLTVKDEKQAREIALRLDRLNADRQAEEARINQAIAEQFERSPELHEAPCIIVDGEGWHRGVIGICASRVVDRWRRPAIVIAQEGLEAYGSGRSIGSFHLLNAIENLRRPFCAPRRARCRHRLRHAGPTFAGVPSPGGSLCAGASAAGGVRGAPRVRRRTAAGRGHAALLRANAAIGALRQRQPGAGIRGARRGSHRGAARAEGEAPQAAPEARRREPAARDPLHPP